MQVLNFVSPWKEAPVYYKRVTSSTMEEAELLLHQPCPHGTVITTDFQTAGRGRFKDRKWEAEEAENLLFTVILHKNSLKVEKSLLPLLAGLALTLTLEKLYSLSTQIKWPNDVLVNGHKVAGILCVGKKDFILMGIGINCNQKQFPPQLAEVASLSWFLQTPVDKMVLLQEVLTCLKQVLTEENRAEELEERLYLKGEKGRIIYYKGNVLKEVEGIITGLGTHGELKLRPFGEKKDSLFISGEVKAIF
jgi:BirA family biotin operon repressor/biotin-[acetyl-CoA-carboxylase] ligase